MDCTKIVFLGGSHVQGTGAEWPHLSGHLTKVPKEFKRNSWVQYLKSTDDTPSEIYKEYLENTSQINFNFSGTEVQELRDKYCWASLFTKHYNKEYINLAFPAYNLYQIAAKLLAGQDHNGKIITDDFTDALVILGVPDLKHDLIYHAPINSQNLQNVTVPYVASILILMREFVENRGGKFVYFHVEDYPDEFYNPKVNPFLYHLNNMKLFDRDLYSLFTPSFEKKKYDGVHYDMSGHNFIADILRKEFENTLIFSILSS